MKITASMKGKFLKKVLKKEQNKKDLEEIKRLKQEVERLKRQWKE